MAMYFFFIQPTRRSKMIGNPMVSIGNNNGQTTINKQNNKPLYRMAKSFHQD
jgi:hypothetical protein